MVLSPVRASFLLSGLAGLLLLVIRMLVIRGEKLAQRFLGRRIGQEGNEDERSYRSKRKWCDRL